MKKLLLTSVLCAAGILSAVADEVRSSDSPRWYISPGVGMMFFEGNQCVDEGLNMVLRAGYNFAENWALEAGISWAPNITGNGHDSHDDGDRAGGGGGGCAACGGGGGDGHNCYDIGGQNVRGAFADALYHFRPYEHLDPYLAAGWGYYRAHRDIFCEGDENDVTGPRVGLGAFYHLNDRWSLRADFHTMMAVDETCECLYTFDLGLAYFFGGSGDNGDTAAATVIPVTATLPDQSGPKDTDGDGLSDEEERRLGTDPFNPDTDGDGLKDGAEVNTYKTNPLNADTDFDGLSDGEEVLKYKTNPLDPDTDKGGVSDGHEVKTDHTNPLDPADDLMLYSFNIEFDYDNAVIKDIYHNDLNMVVRTLLANPGATAVIEGHADRRTGSGQTYNQNLSETRAKAVLNYLTARGVKNKMTAVGYGFTRPKEQPDLINGNPANRRVEIYIRGAGTNADKGRYMK